MIGPPCEPYKIRERLYALSAVEMRSFAAVSSRTKRVAAMLFYLAGQRLVS